MVEMYEKLGLFYLGNDIDPASQEITDTLTLLKNKNLTTHAAIIGMTGSGKTGLGIGLIEEAAIDNIPTIVIDPKGDMGNLCLTDPSFSADAFEPWVTDEAQAKEIPPHTYAQNIANMWKTGLERSHQNSQRVATFSQVNKTIYTPGSRAGVSINILSSLNAPPYEILNDSDAFASYIKTTINSLLALVGVNADPIQSKEYNLLAHIITQAWLKHLSLTLEDLIGQIISPPFDKIGVLPLEKLYPRAERFKLATQFNAIIASPTFSAWLTGEELDIQKLLYDDNGQAKIAIFSIAHLNDDERMFFVTLLLNKYIAWMRQQSGTSALKTLLYMDEIYGFFPPIKNPPSKEPMLQMLKQARAFGVGVILSTQNPVDLDYKGLSNIGSWFIGRLQTTQDIDRVIDGLEGKIGSDYSKQDIRRLLANLKKRTFFLKSAHMDGIRIFNTRWVLSYLKGPLKRHEIEQLMHPQKKALHSISPPKPPLTIPSTQTEFKSYSEIEHHIPQYFQVNLTHQPLFYASMVAHGTLHFFNQTRGIDEQEAFTLTLPLNASTPKADWNQAIINPDFSEFKQWPTTPPSHAQYTPLPEYIKHDKHLKKNAVVLKSWLYHNRKLTLYRSNNPKLESRPHEPLADFKVRLNDLLNDKKESALQILQERYAKKEQTLLKRLARAQERVEKEESDQKSSMLNTGIALLSALFGRTSTAKAGRVLSKSSRIFKERGDVNRAKNRVFEIQDELEKLEYEFEDKANALTEKFNINTVTIKEFSIKLRKTDIEIKEIAIAWHTEYR